MNPKFTEGFRQQAVEKVLNRSADQSIKVLAEELGIGYSTLQKWTARASHQTLENPASPVTNETEKRPQDWSLESRFEIILECAALEEEQISQRCRERGIFPHHLQQWKIDFMRQKSPSISQQKVDIKALKKQNQQLKKELHRKEKALAEAAALLILKKKIDQHWYENAEI